jgi:hypothetical protein
MLYLMSALTGKADEAILKCKNQRPQLKYRDICWMLRMWYGYPDTPELARKKLKHLKQGPDQSLDELARYTYMNAYMAYPGKASERIERLFWLPVFMNAIADPRIARGVRESQPQSVANALKEAQRLETELAFNQMG